MRGSDQQSGPGRIRSCPSPVAARERSPRPEPAPWAIAPGTGPAPPGHPGRHCRASRSRLSSLSRFPAIRERFALAQRQAPEVVSQSVGAWREYAGSAVDGIIVARALHVLGVVVWIGGVAMVTTVLLPAIRRGALGADRLTAFQA